MMWQDLLCTRWVKKAVVAHALAETFGRRDQDVMIVDEITPGPQVNGTAILVEQIRRQGRFPMRLSVYLRDHELDAAVERSGADRDLVGRLARLIGVSCLMLGDESDPFADWLIAPDGSVEEVTDFQEAE